MPHVSPEGTRAINSFPNSPGEHISGGLASEVVNHVFAASLTLTVARAALGPAAGPSGIAEADHRIAVAVQQLDELVRLVQVAAFRPAPAQPELGVPAGFDTSDALGWSARPLSLEIAADGPDVRVTVTGELDRATRPYFAGLLAPVLSRGGRHLVLDCSELSFVDAAGVDAIAELEHQLERVGGGLELQPPSSALTRLVGLFHAWEAETATIPPA